MPPHGEVNSPLREGRRSGLAGADRGFDGLRFPAGTGRNERSYDSRFARSQTLNGKRLRQPVKAAIRQIRL